MKITTREKRIIGEAEEDQPHRGFPENMANRGYVARLQNAVKLANSIPPTRKFRLVCGPAKLGGQPTFMTVNLDAPQESE